MLLIQQVTLTWWKGERGGKGAEARTRFPLTWPVEGTPFDPQPEVLVHRLHFYQRGEKFLSSEENCRYCLERYLPCRGYTPQQCQTEIARRQRSLRQTQLLPYPAAADVNLAHLALRPGALGWEVLFRWDGRRGGLPFRRGRNRDYNDPASPFYCQDCLNETAFALAPGQYGQITWNERRQDWDDGTWYYCLHAYNLVELPPGVSPTYVFLRQEPDFTYRQMAALY
jgi:hypothetical protein